MHRVETALFPTDLPPPGPARLLVREAVEALRCNYAVFDAGRRLVDFSDSYAALHGLDNDAARQGPSYDEIMRAAVERTLDDASPQEKADEVARRVAAHEADNPGEFDRLYSGGRWMRVSKRRLPGGYVAGLAIDITELKEREIAIAASEARYRALIDTAPVGIWHLDERGRTLLSNTRLAGLYGGAVPDWLEGLRRLSSSPSDGPFGFPCGREVEAEIPAQCNRAGAHVLVCASDWLVGPGDSRTAILTLLDITPLKAAQSQAEHLAWHDALTGLANRLRLRQALADMEAAGQPAVLVLIDLDRFKDVNDRHGHAAGDALLRAVAVRLQMVAAPGDLACRPGGDEFAVLVLGPDAIRRGPLLAETLARTLSEPVVADGVVIPAAASIGHAAFPADAADSEGLQRAADAALYAAKHEGRSRSVPFRLTLLDGVRQRSQVVAAFTAALASDGLRLAWQTQLSIPGRSLRGAQAVALWPGQPGSPDAALSPATMATLGEAGLLRALDDWMLGAAVAQMALWSSSPGSPGIGSVQVSAASLSDPALPARIATLLLRHRLAADALEIGVPDNIASTDLETISPVLKDLRAIGVHLAVDGIGHGAVTVSHLVQWRIGLLKLSPAAGGSFSSIQERSVVQAIVAMGDALGIPVMAAGIETEAQLFSLRRAGCRLMQGTYFPAPLAAGGVLPAMVQQAGAP